MPITLAEPRYEPVTVRDEEFVMQVNPSLSILSDLQSDNGERTIAALERIIKSHPVLDGSGKPAAIADFDSDLAGEITQAWAAYLRTLPKASPARSATPGSHRRR